MRKIFLPAEFYHLDKPGLIMVIVWECRENKKRLLKILQRENSTDDRLGIKGWRLISAYNF